MGTATFKMCWHNGFHDIPCLEAVLRMFLLGISTGEAVFVHQTHLPTAMPMSGNCQWRECSYFDVLRRTLTYAGSIYQMGLGQFSFAPVILREPSRTTRKRESQYLQPSK